MLNRKGLALVAALAFVSGGLALNHYKDDIPSNLKIGAMSFGDAKTIRVGDYYIGDDVTIVEFEGVRRNYRNMGLSSKDALADFSKLILMDRFINRVSPELKFEETSFYNSIDDGLMDSDSKAVKDLEELLGLDYEGIKEIVVISEKRANFESGVTGMIMNSDSLKPLYDSVTRNLIVDDYVVDFDKIDGHNATEDDYLAFYKENKIKESDTLDVEKYTVRGVEGRESIDKFLYGDIESTRSRIMDYESEREDVVIKITDMDKIMSSFVEYRGGEVFVDDNTFDEDGLVTVYLVNKVNEGREYDINEARGIVKPAITRSNKMDYINKALVDKVLNGESIENEEYLIKVGSDIEYNMVKDYDNPLFEVLIGLSKGDFYSYNRDGEVHILNIVDVRELDDLTDEHKEVINQYYATKLKEELIKFQELIMFGGVESKSYNFEEF